MCCLYQNHVKRKVKVCQQSNRCLAWAKKNLALVACWMIVACVFYERIDRLYGWVSKSRGLVSAYETSLKRIYF